ncbi:MAG: D-alanyl-D-alanine carboxypeptidase/D-alanyl-D-alanine-endopeptidase [Anaeromyxobacter sp.]
MPLPTGALAAVLASLVAATPQPSVRVASANSQSNSSASLSQSNGFAAPGAATPDRTELVEALNAIAAADPLARARVGIYVAPADGGPAVYSKDGDALLNPASNVKLVTTAAALARLGPEYRFATEFLVDGAPDLSRVKALHVRGRGDPSLVTERLWAIAGDLAHLGLRRVDELVLDDGFFDAERTGPGFDQEEGDRAYLAPAGALSLNFNAIGVHVAPGPARGQRARVEVEPESGWVVLENRTQTASRTARSSVKVSAELRGGKQRVVVEGRIPLGARPTVIWRRVEDPAAYLGATLVRLLELRGVKVGRVRAGPVPASARLLYVTQSDELADIVRRLNKHSNNFIAEQLLKTLGAEVKGAPGSWPKGTAVTQDFLAEVGVAPGTYVMTNGSGLNDANRFSAHQLVTVLQAMWSRFPLQPEYLGSLPVAARDGTIRWRMEGTEAAGRLRAKTGSLEGVVSLAGYVQTAGGKVLAFAVLVNDSPGRWPVLRAVDAVGATLAASGGPPGALAAAAAPPPAPVPDLAGAARTFYGFGRKGDLRNEPLLRGALRSTADPALRLAIAECVYLSDPEGEAARRSFLEALAADPQAVVRLWTALLDEPQPPVISSLADLAADAEPEALRRLVELAQPSQAEPHLEAAVASALAGVANAAPAELVEALRFAQPPARQAALRSLVTGLGRAEDGDAPFAAGLQTLAAGDGPSAPFARELGPALAVARDEVRRRQEAPRLEPVPASGVGR